MRYRLLGPLEVWQDGRQLAIGGPQQKALLAILLLNANRVVSADRLVAQLWDEEPPPMARSLLQGCVARLRRALWADQGPDQQPLLTRPPGYLLRVEPGELDLDRFEELAREAHASPDLDQRAGLLAEALALYRGPALDGLDVDACRVDGARLEERKLTVLEQRIETDLRRGAHTGLVGELRTHVGSHPLRERLWALLIAILYAVDRQADALATYQELRDTLVEQLGIEPSSLVQELHRQILAGVDPGELVIPTRSGAGPEPVPVSFVPAQLPAAPAGFVGRQDSLAHLDGLLAEVSRGMTIGVLSGAAGVGKTALAVHWAHQVRDQFADGQLYVDLRGYASTAPVSVAEALAGFLRALGVTADRVPVDPEQAAALYRSLLAGKQMLVVLDNAHSVEQVRPLLPGGAGCLVLVTGRGRLAGLVARDGARLHCLDVLEPAEATGLLARLLGPERVEAEPQASEELARLCGYLPLALRIAAAHLVGHPARRVADQVVELTADRLAALAVGDDERCAVRVAFDHSYAALRPEVARMFRLLGLVPGPDFTVDAAAALAGVAPAVARALLNELAAAHLVDRPAPDRFVFHDLIRLYARERLTDADRVEPPRRLSAWYLEMADSATRLLCPQLLRLPSATQRFEYADPEAALSWLDAERANLVAATVAAAEHGPRETAWLLADAQRGYWWLRRHGVEWLTVAEAGLTAAQAAGEPRAQAAAEFNLGMANLCQNRYQQAIEHQSRALQLCLQSGWDEGAANALGNLGMVHYELGELDRAIDYHQRALALNRRLGSERGEAVNLDNLGLVCLVAGRLEQAGVQLRQALGLHRRLGDQHGEAVSAQQLGVLSGRLGRAEEAMTFLADALGLYRQLGNINGQAMTLAATAAVCNDTGRPAAALEHAGSGFELIHQAGDRYSEALIRNQLGAAQHQLGDHAQAINHHSRALFRARETGGRYPEVEALVGLAAAHHARGGTERAMQLAEQALALAEQIGYRLLAAQAHLVLAGIHPDPAQVAEHARRAMNIGDQTTRARAAGLVPGEEPVAAPVGRRTRSARRTATIRRMPKVAGAVPAS